MRIPEPMLIEAYQEDDEWVFQERPQTAFEKIRDLLKNKEPRGEARSPRTEFPF